MIHRSHYQLVDNRNHAIHQHRKLRLVHYCLFLSSSQFFLNCKSKMLGFVKFNWLIGILIYVLVVNAS